MVGFWDSIPGTGRCCWAASRWPGCWLYSSDHPFFGISIRRPLLADFERFDPHPGWPGRAGRDPISRPI
jgi:hypothetical protein